MVLTATLYGDIVYMGIELLINFLTRFEGMQVDIMNAKREDNYAQVNNHKRDTQQSSQL